MTSAIHIARRRPGALLGASSSGGVLPLFRAGHKSLPFREIPSINQEGTNGNIDNSKVFSGLNYQAETTTTDHKFTTNVFTNTEGEVLVVEAGISPQVSTPENDASLYGGRPSVELVNTLSPKAEDEAAHVSSGYYEQKKNSTIRVGDGQNSIDEQLTSGTRPITPVTGEDTRHSTVNTKTIVPFSNETHVGYTGVAETAVQVTLDPIEVTSIMHSVTEGISAVEATHTPMPFIIDEDSVNTETDIPMSRETTEIDIPFSAEIAEISLSAAEETISHVDNTVKSTTLVVPMDEMSSVTVIPVMGETTRSDLPVTEEFTETITPITEEFTETITPITEEFTETITPITEEFTETITPITEEFTETITPITEEFTETIAPFSAEITETFMPVTVGNIDVITLATEESRGSTMPVAEENTDPLILVTEETPEILVQVKENVTNTILLGSEENTETMSSVTRETTDAENVDIDGMVNDETTDITGISETIAPISTGETVGGASRNRIVGVGFRNHKTGGNTFKLNSTEASGDVVLEASPGLGIGQVNGEGPLEPAIFDVKIKTIKDLQVDLHDAIFDPSQIAKATSYQESSYSTATRSATVTTWVDPNSSRNFISQGYANLTNLKEMVLNSEQNSQGNSDSIKVLPNQFNGSANQGVGDITNRLPATEIPDVSGEPLQSVDHSGTTTLKGGIDYKVEDKEIATELERNDRLSETLKLIPESVENDNPQIPVFKLNDGEYETVNGTRVYATNRNKTETRFIYELPDVTRSSGPHLTPSVVIALSVCCSVIVLISILTVSLWFCRRHKNRSKIYLTRDAARPRAFFTKPMNPALMPNERPQVADSMYVIEFQKPRAPVVLSDDPDCVVIDGETILKSQTEGPSGGIDNQSFVDIPLEEIKSKNCYLKNSKTFGRNPPKIGSKCQHECDADSGIRVWSSTGSLYTVSPELSHCSVPPPPYSSSIGKENVDFSTDALCALGSKSRLLYV